MSEPTRFAQQVPMTDDWMDDGHRYNIGSVTVTVTQEMIDRVRPRQAFTRSIKQAMGRLVCARLEHEREQELRTWVDFGTHSRPFVQYALRNGSQDGRLPVLLWP